MLDVIVTCDDYAPGLFFPVQTSNNCSCCSFSQMHVLIRSHFLDCKRHHPAAAFFSQLVTYQTYDIATSLREPRERWSKTYESSHNPAYTLNKCIISLTLAYYSLPFYNEFQKAHTSGPTQLASPFSSGAGLSAAAWICPPSCAAHLTGNPALHPVAAVVICVLLPWLGSLAPLKLAHPLFLMNRSRIDLPPAIFSVPSRIPWMPKYAIGSLPPSHPDSTPPAMTATPRNCLAREQAIAYVMLPPYEKPMEKRCAVSTHNPASM